MGGHGKELGKTTTSPLSPELWLGRLSLLKKRVSTSSFDIEQALRHAFHLSLLALGPFADLLGASCDEDRFEHLLEKKQYYAAADILTASDFFDISANIADGHAVVQITTEIYVLNVEVTARDTTTAMLIAWIEIILNIEKAALDIDASSTDPTLRIFQSAQHRRSTQH